MIEARLTDSNFHELGILKLAAPCAEPWDEMKGDDRVRRCERCKLSVYNLEQLTTDEARALFRQRVPGRICARFYRRYDGTVLTKDCKRGLDRAWHRARSLLPGVGWFTLLLAVGLTAILGVAALFGENLRRLEAMSGSMELTGAHAPPNKPRNRF